MHDIQFIPRPCDRCGAGTIDDDYSNDRIITPLCAEFQMASGVIAWLCLNCRRDWHKALDAHKLSIDYEQASLEFEVWKMRVSIDKKFDSNDMLKGHELLQKVSKLEKDINLFANEWLV